ERLAYTADYEKIELIEYLREVIKDLEPTVAPCTIQFEAPQAIQFAADRAILVGLIITELVSNAGKYAYPDSSGGSIWVQALPQADKQASLLVGGDEGVQVSLETLAQVGAHSDSHRHLRLPAHVMCSPVRASQIAHA